MAAPHFRGVYGVGRRTSAYEMIWRIIAAVLSGVAGALGIGGGGILIIYLTLCEQLPQLSAQGINLLFFLPCGLVAVTIHAIKKRIDFKTAWQMVLGGIPAAILGVLLGNFIGGEWLGKAFAVLLIFLGIKAVFAEKKQKD